MSNTHVELKLQPPRSKRRKARLASSLRAKGRSEQEIKRVVFHPENSPIQGGY